MVRGIKGGGRGFGFIFGKGLWRAGRGGGGGRGFFAPESFEIDAVALDPRLHLPFGQAEATGGGGHFAVGVFQFANDYLEFKGGDGSVEGAGSSGGFGGFFFLQGGREVMRLNGCFVERAGDEFLADSGFAPDSPRTRTVVMLSATSYLGQSIWW